MRNTEALQYVCLVFCLFASMTHEDWQLPPALPPLPLFNHPPCSHSSSLCISESGLKIDENLLWDYVLWAANNVEEPPGLPLPQQRCNKARSWEIHGYLMETEASELPCYIYRLPFCLSFSHPALVCRACTPVSHLGGDLASAVPSDSLAASHATATNTRSACTGNKAGGLVRVQSLWLLLKVTLGYAAKKKTGDKEWKL